MHGPRTPVRKPWDVGDGQVAAAVGTTAQVLSVHGPHPRWGWVHLSSFLPFDESSRHDPDAVRAYRRRLEDPDGPGLRLTVQDLELVGRRWKKGAVPEFTYRGPHMTGQLTVFAADGRLLLWMRVRPAGSCAPRRVRARFEASWWVHRAAYAQITEGGPLPRPEATNYLRGAGGALVWESPGLPAWGVVWPVHTCLAQQGRGPLRVTWEEEWSLDAGEVHRVLAVQLFSRRPELCLPKPQVEELEAILERVVRDRLWVAPLPRNPRLRRFVHRQLVFVLDACAVGVDGATCLVTDPVLLPLSWNRDSYYMACLLGAAVRTGQGPLCQRARSALVGHLRWLFRVAQRPSGWWARSYLTGGAVKDPAYQLDQQWYPILEAVRAALDWGVAEAWREHGREVVDAARRLLEARHPNGLWPTSETPADDPLPLPYHFSSHVLAWRTLNLLAELDPGGPWRWEAARVRKASLAAFRAPDGTFAYATDGKRYLSYHDANDLPVACAPRWGFCSSKDPWWHKTVAFAWSTENPGFFAGPYGSLGSRHAPGPWTLGDLQAWIVGMCTADRARLRQAWHRLRRVAFDDDLLCESYDPHTGRPRTRAYFAWPGAAAAALLLGDPL